MRCLAAVLVLAACQGAARTPPATVDAGPPPTQSPDPYAIFRQIAPGMTSDEVLALAGEPEARASAWIYRRDGGWTFAVHREGGKATAVVVISEPAPDPFPAATARRATTVRKRRPLPPGLRDARPGRTETEIAGLLGAPDAEVEVWTWAPVGSPLVKMTPRAYFVGGRVAEKVGHTTYTCRLLP